LDLGKIFFSLVGNLAKSGNKKDFGCFSSQLVITFYKLRIASANQKIKKLQFIAS